MHLKIRTSITSTSRRLLSAPSSGGQIMNGLIISLIISAPSSSSRLGHGHERDLHRGHERDPHRGAGSPERRLTCHPPLAVNNETGQSYRTDGQFAMFWDEPHLTPARRRVPRCGKNSVSASCQLVHVLNRSRILAINSWLL